MFRSVSSVDMTKEKRQISVDECERGAMVRENEILMADIWVKQGRKDMNIMSEGGVMFRRGEITFS